MVTEVGIDTATNAISVVVLYVDFGEQKVLYPGKGELRRAVPKRLLNVPVQVRNDWLIVLLLDKDIKNLRSRGASWTTSCPWAASTSASS